MDCGFEEGAELEPRPGCKKCPPGPDRHNIRSATPIGFARAVFEANGRAVALAAA